MKHFAKPPSYHGSQEKLPRILESTVSKLQTRHSNSLSENKLPKLIIQNYFDLPGCEIKKGWSVNLDVVSIHHDPDVFPNPEKFDPSRFDVSSIKFLPDSLQVNSFIWVVIR